MEQRDRSLTVMIPRAKYHSTTPGALDVENDKRSVCSTSEAKLLNYLDASPSTSKVSTNFREVSKISNLFSTLRRIYNDLNHLHRQQQIDHHHHHFTQFHQVRS